METALGVNGGGCGCKLPAARLLELLAPLRAAGEADDRLLVGSATADDAAVYRIDDRRALVQTVDFFPPPVEDLYDFGRIAATNALSDVYAMGAEPLTALNLVAFPLGAMDELPELLRGGADVCAAAGVSVVGGHSIDSDQPHFGLAVTGIVALEDVVTNAGARPGDTLVLTKPLGVGAAMFGHRRGAADDDVLTSAVAVMCRSNREAARAARARAHAMTDVTGFGLLGHLHHLCRESGLTAEIDAAAVPVLDERVAALLAEDDGMSAGARRNADWARSFTRFASSVPEWRRRLLADPTTSGGLLVALAGDPDGVGVSIGRLREGEAGMIVVG